jgi:hypothetical protein
VTPRLGCRASETLRVRPKWVVILGRALGRWKHLDRRGMRRAEIYGTIALGISIFLFIVIRLVVG